MKKLKEKGVEVIGISGDSVRTQQLFKKAHNLNFTLLADENGSVAKRFGVPLRKGGSIKHVFNGKEEILTRGVTPSRWTFVVNKAGKIVLKNTQVDAANDSKAILSAVEGMK